MESKPNIHINPKFKNAHINPNFIQQTSRILINPRFLQQQQNGSELSISSSSQHHAYPSRPSEIHHQPTPLPSTAIIRNTRRTLIRAPAVSQQPIRPVISTPNPPVALTTSSTAQNNHLIKIGKNKLVTAAHLMNAQQKANEIIKSKTESLIKTVKLKRNEIKSAKSIYKLDRRRQDVIGSKKKKIVRKYSIKRVEQPKMPEIRKKFNTSTSYNGFVLRTSISIKVHINNLTNLFSLSPLSRTINRTNRSHLSTIKTRSISLLNKSTARKKSNEICPIFRRLGKCLAQKRGRCHKVHDKNYVNVCGKFLRGSCQDENCLLSHDTSYRKMPVCKYFLKGMCHKPEECRYLHKKQSDDTSICAEFAKGYCVEGEKVKCRWEIWYFHLNAALLTRFQCKLLHDYPETTTTKIRSKKLNNVTRKKITESTATEENIAAPSTSSAVHSRYFIDEGQPNESIIPQRKKVETLPGYIPLWIPSDRVS